MSKTIQCLEVCVPAVCFVSRKHAFLRRNSTRLSARALGAALLHPETFDIFHLRQRKTAAVVHLVRPPENRPYVRASAGAVPLCSSGWVGIRKTDPISRPGEACPYGSNRRRLIGHAARIFGWGGEIRDAF